MAARCWHDHYLKCQAFLACLALEDTPHRLHQCGQVYGLRRQGQVPGLDAHDIEDIADQAQQVFGRMVGKLECATVQPTLVGAFHRQFEHADHGNDRLI